MNIDGTHYRTIWLEAPGIVRIIDQSRLPHHFEFLDIASAADMALAIRDMKLRGAGLIGAAAGWGMYLAALAHADASAVAFTAAMEEEGRLLNATRPTAKNLEWAVQRMQQALQTAESSRDRIAVAKQTAQAIADEDAEFCRRIGQHGCQLLRDIAKRKPGQTINVLTHCNAGWLAFVDYGTALAPVYAAFDEGLDIHVWVDETRPRNQGAALTAWELSKHGVPHTLVADNAGGHLMQHGLVDIVFVGSDRTTASGDVANKIGTYLKALAAHDNGIPFYAALPSSTLDWQMEDGVRDIPIEQRNADEVIYATGWHDATQSVASVRVCPAETPAANYGFDVTPARLVTGIITERGIAPATKEGLRALYADAAEPDEGYIKFSVDHTPAPPPDHPGLPALMALRDRLVQMDLIGLLPNGISFGNVSIRAEDGKPFIITGSSTGGIVPITPEQFCTVDECDAADNRVVCHGPCVASSESLSHAAVYAARPDAGAVLHIHAPQLFAKLVEQNAPSTPATAAFGTPELALALKDLCHTLPESACIVLRGHPDGLLIYGPTPDAAFHTLAAILGPSIIY